MSPTELSVHRFASFDGVELAWRELGEGRPVVLLHGFFSDAMTNWVRYGHASAIAAKGFRVIMPDLRAHGSSAKLHVASAYPADVLSGDGFALIAYLGLTDYDLGGYSLGARTAVRMLIAGAKPRRAVIAGMGYSGLTAASKRSAHFAHILDNLGSFEKFTLGWNAEAFLKTTKGDPVALRLLLDSFIDSDRAAIADITTPALVLSGDQDEDNGSVVELANALRQATLVRTPGGHMSAVTRPELGAALADFLAD